jgi:hypothetical protein
MAERDESETGTAVNWIRRRRRIRMKPFDESALPEPKLPSVEEATSDGLMLAEHAAQMALKNLIIVGALGGPDSYDATHYLGSAAGVLDELAGEFEQDGARVARALRSIENRPGRATRVHDYRSADTKNLRMRQAVLRSLVDHLRDHRDDRAYLRNLIERARKDAWSDVSLQVQDSLDRSRIVVDTAYERDRGERMRLLSDDLVALAAGSKRTATRKPPPVDGPR